MNNYLARVNPRYFAAMRLFGGDSDVRYYLNGVFITPHQDKGVIMVATNGHLMAAIHDPDGEVKSPIIVGDLSKQLLSTCKQRGSAPKFTVPKNLWIGQHHSVVMGDKDGAEPEHPFGGFAIHTSKTAIIDGKYPDWQRVLPTKRVAPGEKFPCIGSQYLSIVDQAAEILCRHKYKGLHMESTGENTSVVCRLNSGDLMDRFVALIMPMRDDKPKEILPSWLMQAPGAPAP